MMARSAWNRSRRRSGGNRPARIVVPSPAAGEAHIVLQRERTRAACGAEGVRRFDAALLAWAEVEDHVLMCTAATCDWSGQASGCLMTTDYAHLCPRCAAMAEPVEGPWGTEA